MSATHQSNTFLGGIVAAFTAAVLTGLITSPASTPAVAQTSGCDCSCASYTKLRQIMEEFEARQDSETPQSIPPEMMQMSMCAGQCAMKWAQCENPNVDFGGMQEAQKRALQPSRQGGSDYSGNDAIARERAINERRIGETEKNLEADAAGLPAERLTDDYLEGTWCSVYGGQEKAQWHFDSSGSYEIGLPAGNGWAMQKSGDSIDEFQDRFEKLIDFQRDSFTTEHRHGRKNVFTRGPCS